MALRKGKKVKLADVAGAVALGPAYIGGRIIADTINQKKGILLPREEFFSDSFDIPNLVQIVDDATRRDSKDFESSVGYRTEANKMEIMHIFDTEVDSCGLSFYPASVCDAFYYVDPHDKNCLINIDSLFAKAQEQKIAELVNIAYCLGAKRYEIEIVEETKEESHFKRSAEQSVNVKMVEAGAGYEASADSGKSTKVRFHTVEEYHSRRKPKIPELVWFKNDDNVLGMIDHICRDGAKIKSKDLIFEGAKFSVMSEATAAKVDAAVKRIGSKAKANLQKQAKSEMLSKICYHLEF